MFEEIKKVIAETLNCDEEKITPEANLFDDLGADSLDAVELNMALEEKFGVTIEDEAMAQIKTVADIVNLLENNQ